MRRSRPFANGLCTGIWIVVALVFSAALIRGGPKPVAELPCEIQDNLLYTKVRVNNRGPFRFCFDTGASYTCADKSVARKMGLEKTGGFALWAIGARSVVANRYAQATLSAGGYSNLDIFPAGFDLKQMWDPSGPADDGILGSDFFGEHVVEIDYSNKVVRLYRPNDPPCRTGGEYVPFELRDDDVTIKAEVAIRGRRVEGTFLVDTGAYQSLSLSERFVSKHDLMSPEQKRLPVEVVNGGIPGVDRGRLSRVGSLTIGRSVIQSPITSFITDDNRIHSDPDFDGIIGGGILRRFRLVVDYPEQTIYFEKNQSFDEPEVKPSVGIEIDSDSQSPLEAYISRVTPGGAADKAGLKKGDRISNVGGKSLDTLEEDDFDKFFAKPGNRVPFTVCRGGKRVTTVVVVENLK